MRKNYKTLMNNVKELNKWKDIPCSCIYRLNTIPIKIPVDFFVEIDS